MKSFKAIPIIIFVSLFTSCKEPVNKEINLPVMEIATENGAPINSKETYINGFVEISIFNNDNEEIIASGDMEIKGRGNSTWTQPKKPYRIKFKDKKSFFGFPESKHWVLLANYMDKSMLRNEVAFEMGRISVLDWTPRTQFLEIYLNEEYQGTYQLTEQIRIDENRVNITDDGFIIEVDVIDKIGQDDVTFETDRVLFSIKAPDVEENDERYNWIKNHIIFIENILYSNNFLDPETGYKKYIDIESFVDWYLINEIAKNPDAVFTSSCYMNIVAPDGKLKMGPLWDFDTGFGCGYFDYYDATPNDFWVKGSKWISIMFLDPEFVNMVKTRFDYFKSNKNLIINSLLSNALTIQRSAIYNEQKWKYLQDSEDFEIILSKYNDEVKYLENWINQRFDWLENAYNEL
ncbi:MAG: CotH kinase family protein [Bacteroidales bacterium]|jgi:hypothetical protein|nr:CotH kinase family protein [Bacteroidales bacterium]